MVAGTVWPQASRCRLSVTAPCYSRYGTGPAASSPARAKCAVVPRYDVPIDAWPPRTQVLRSSVDDARRASCVPWGCGTAEPPSRGPRLVSDWEIEAHNWVRWARTPGHDEYWRYREVFFGALVPPPGRRTLEIGSGEGRVARDLAVRGHRVVGLDTSPTLARYAKEAGKGPCYLLADAAALPFPDESFDLVVAYNSLMDVEDMPASVSEAGRVLTRPGRFCICVTHPFADAGEFSGKGPDVGFTMIRPYFGQGRFEGSAERDGLTMTFRGWTHSLEDYAIALESAGLVVELLREPRPARSSAGDESELPLPMFLYLRAMKPVA